MVALPPVLCTGGTHWVGGAGTNLAVVSGIISVIVSGINVNNTVSGNISTYTTTNTSVTSVTGTTTPRCRCSASGS